MRSASRPMASLARVTALFLVACRGVESPTTPSSYQPSIPPRVTRVVISGVPATIGVGETALLEAWTEAEGVGRVRPDTPVVWSLADQSIAAIVPVNNDSIAGAGLAGVDYWARIRAVAKGTITVRAASGDKSSAATIAVGAPAAFLTISPTTVTVDANKCETRRLAVSLFDAAGNRLSGRRLVWTSTDPRIAQAVNVPGDSGSAAWVGGENSGTATITASTGLVSASAAVTVTQLGSPNWSC